MKAAVVALPVSMLLSMGLLGMIKIRKKELDVEMKQRKFREITMQVNIDLLEEGLKQIAETQKLLEKSQSEIQALTDKHNMINARAEQAKINYDDCSGDQKLFVDQIGETQTEYSTLKNLCADERSEWKRQALELKEQLDGQSLVCKFLKSGDHQGRHICKATEVGNKKENKSEINKEEPKEPELKEADKL